MLPLLARYKSLQEADLALRGVAGRLAKFAGSRAGLEQRLAAARMPLKTQQEAVAAATKQARAVDQQLADLAEKKKKEQGRTFSVKTQVELNALEREVAVLAGKISATEEEGLRLLEELENLRAQLPALEAAQRLAEGEIAATGQALAAEEKTLLAEQARLTAARAAANERLSEEERDEYLKVAAHRDGVVVAELDPVKFTCGGCVIRVRPQLVEELYNGRLVRCEECQRFLYESADARPESAPGA